MRTLPPALLLSCLLASAAWADVPPPPPPEPTVVGVAVPDTDHLVVLSDPLGESDDRTATRLEKLLRADDASLRACREQALARGKSPMRFLQMHLRFRTDGTVRSVKVTSSTEDDTLDECAADVVRAVKLDPPPQFPDYLNLGITWALATKKPE
jgi:TonB family protein